MDCGQTIGSSRPVITFGELLMRLDAPGERRLVQADSFDVSFTGGEANVAVALAQWGLPARIVSKVPEHELGEACLNHFRRYGADVQNVIRGGERLGILFVEMGASQRGGKVVYDRLQTGFRSLRPGELDWEAILIDAGWFHFTGTAPAVGEHVREVLREGLAAAKRLKVPVSFDCSFRSTLWSEKEAAEVFPSLMEYVDMFIGSSRDAELFFGVTDDGRESLSSLQQKYGLACVAYTERRVEPTGINHYSALVLDGGEFYASPTYAIQVVDRIGAGDAFAAGLIRGRLLGQLSRDTVEFATAAAVLKHSIPGDFALLRVGEIDQLARGGAVGQIRR